MLVLVLELTVAEALFILFSHFCALWVLTKWLLYLTECLAIYVVKKYHKKVLNEKNHIPRH